MKSSSILLDDAGSTYVVIFFKGVKVFFNHSFEVLLASLLVCLACHKKVLGNHNASFQCNDHKNEPPLIVLDNSSIVCILKPGLLDRWGDIPIPFKPLRTLYTIQYTAPS